MPTAVCIPAGVSCPESLSQKTANLPLIDANDTITLAMNNYNSKRRYLHDYCWNARSLSRNCGRFPGVALIWGDRTLLPASQSPVPRSAARVQSQTPSHLLGHAIMLVEISSSCLCPSLLSTSKIVCNRCVVVGADPEADLGRKARFPITLRIWNLHPSMSLLDYDTN